MMDAETADKLIQPIPPNRREFPAESLVGFIGPLVCKMAPKSSVVEDVISSGRYPAKEMSDKYIRDNHMFGAGDFSMLTNAPQDGDGLPARSSAEGSIHVFRPTLRRCDGGGNAWCPFGSASALGLAVTFAILVGFVIAPSARAQTVQVSQSAPGPQVAVVKEASRVQLPPADIPNVPATQPGPAVSNAPQIDQDAALALASRLDGAGGGVSGSELLAALQDAAAAGQPIALWRLGIMYENGEGVQKDDVKAFQFFSRIANDHADAPPRSLEAGIVAQSFVKIGEYYAEGLPSAGIKADTLRAHALLLHAATFFGDADAQYQVGLQYLDKKSFDYNPLQAARWLSLAARKGQVFAQARLGDLLFNGDGIQAQPVEGLMWLSIAHNRTQGTPDEAWIADLLEKDMSAAKAEDRIAATKAADALGPVFDTASASE